MLWDSIFIWDFLKSPIVFLSIFYAAHMPSASWVGLNDIQTENTFVWTDSTPAVSQSYACSHARYRSWSPERDSEETLFVPSCRISYHGSPISPTTGRTMKTVFTFEVWSTRTPAHSMISPVPTPFLTSARKVRNSLWPRHHHCSAESIWHQQFKVDYLWVVFVISTINATVPVLVAKGQGPPVPPTSGPGKQEQAHSDTADTNAHITLRLNMALG